MLFIAPQKQNIKQAFLVFGKRLHHPLKVCDCCQPSKKHSFSSSMCNMTFYQKQNRLTLAIPQKQRWDLKNKIKQEFLVFGKKLHYTLGLCDYWLHDLPNAPKSIPNLAACVIRRFTNDLIVEPLQPLKIKTRNVTFLVFLKKAVFVFCSFGGFCCFLLFSFHEPFFFLKILENIVNVAGSDIHT